MIETPAQAVILFFIYSFLGWVCECIYCSAGQRKWINRGFLAGPYCPIYGFGGVFVLTLLEPVADSFWMVFREPFIRQRSWMNFLQLMAARSTKFLTSL